MSRRTAKDFRDRATKAALDMANMIRRVVTSATAGGRWGIEGYELDDIDTGVAFTEGVDDDPVDVFAGIHIYARPAAADKSEGILLHVGGEAEHPVLAALRNEDARLRYVAEFGDLSRGEVVVFNSAGTARVKVRTNGEIEITVAAGQKLLVKTKAGTALPVATKADVDAIQAALDGHSHLYIPGAGPGTVSTTGNPSVPAPDGTLAFDSE